MLLVLKIIFNQTSMSIILVGKPWISGSGRLDLREKLRRFSKIIQYSLTSSI